MCMLHMASLSIILLHPYSSVYNSETDLFSINIDVTSLVGSALYWEVITECLHVMILTKAVMF